MNLPPAEHRPRQRTVQETQLEPNRSVDPPRIWQRFVDGITSLGKKTFSLIEQWAETTLKEKENEISRESADHSLQKSLTEARINAWQAESARSEAETRLIHAVACRVEAEAAGPGQMANPIYQQPLPQDELIKHLKITQRIVKMGGMITYHFPESPRANASGLGGIIQIEGQSSLIERDAGDSFAPTVGIITALPHECAAIRAILGMPPACHVEGKGAGRRYWKAEVRSASGGVHRVIIAKAAMGTNKAAVRASQLLAHFKVDSIIMCGIAGGIPHVIKPEDHVRLGDVVVSSEKGVVQYDFQKRTAAGQDGEMIEEVRSSGHRPHALLIEAVDLLESDRHLGKYPWEEALRNGLTLLGWTRPDETTDILAHSTNPSLLLEHPRDPERREGQPRILLGPIASANTLLKDPLRRDALRDRFGVKAVEMEASGIVDATWEHEVGYLVVRGICDYCDLNKGDAWQKYAALTAAAYVHALLESMPATN